MSNRFRLVTRIAADPHTYMQQEQLATLGVMFGRAHRRLGQCLNAEAVTKPWVAIPTLSACRLRDFLGDAVRLLGVLREEMAEREGVVRLPDPLRFVREHELRELIEQLDKAIDEAREIDDPHRDVGLICDTLCEVGQYLHKLRL